MPWWYQAVLRIVKLLKAFFRGSRMMRDEAGGPMVVVVVGGYEVDGTR